MRRCEPIGGEVKMRVARSTAPAGAVGADIALSFPRRRESSPLPASPEPPPSGGDRPRGLCAVAGSH